MTALLRRLNRLEKLRTPCATVCLWEEAGTDVIARRFPYGVPEGTIVIVHGWAIESLLASERSYFRIQRLSCQNSDHSVVRCSPMHVRSVVRRGRAAHDDEPRPANTKPKLT